MNFLQTANDKIFFDNLSEKYKDSLAKHQAIFESSFDEVSYFMENHLNNFKNCKNIFYLDLNERYLILGDGNAAFISKESLNEGFWDAVVTGWNATKDIGKFLGKLAVGAFVHSFTAIGEGFNEIINLFSVKKCDVSKLALGIGGLLEISALLVSFIPPLLPIAHGLAAIGGIAFMAGGLLEIFTGESKDLDFGKVNESENINEALFDISNYSNEIQRISSGVLHVIMGISSLVFGAMNFFGGHGIHGFKEWLKGILHEATKAMSTLIKKIVMSSFEKGVSAGLKRSYLQFLKQEGGKKFVLHYASATLAFFTGETTKVGASELQDSGKGFNIYSGIDKVFDKIASILKSAIEKIASTLVDLTSFNEDFKKWTESFMKMLKENIYKIIDVGLGVIKRIAKFFIDLITLKNYYVLLFKENNIQTQNSKGLEAAMYKSLDKKKIEEIGKLKDASPKFKSKINENKNEGPIMKFNEYKTYLNEKKINEGVFSSLLDFSGKAIDNVKAYSRGLIVKWGDKKVTWTKKELNDSLDNILKYCQEGLNSQGVDAVKKILDIVKEDINSGKITKVYDMLKKLESLTGLTLVK